MTLMNEVVLIPSSQAIAVEICAQWPSPYEHFPSFLYCNHMMSVLGAAK